MSTAAAPFITDAASLHALGASPAPFGPQEAEAKAEAAAALIDLARLDPAGTGAATLLWRNDHSEAWLNCWWEPRDTGYHDHDGSCVGVHVLRGRASNESLVVGREQLLRHFGPGESFSFPGHGIHRMDHEPGAITIHVYSPRIQSIGHYEIEDGELRRWPGSPDEPSEPSPALLAVVTQAHGASS